MHLSLKEKFIENVIEYLANAYIQASEKADNLVKQTTIKQGVTEQLKVTNQMKLVGLINNISHSF